MYGIAIDFYIMILLNDIYSMTSDTINMEFRKYEKFGF